MTLQELQSQPRVFRHSLSLKRSSSEHAIRRPGGSHSAFFASARALGECRGGGGSSASCAGVSDGSLRRSTSSAAPRLPTQSAQTFLPSRPAAVTPSTEGVSVAFLLTFLSKFVPEADDATPGQTTRLVARGLKRRMKEADETGTHAGFLVEQNHPVTGGVMAGRTGVCLVHAWDADFRELVDALVVDAQGDLDKRYFLDVFSTDLHAGDDDSIASVQRRIADAETVLLMVDPNGSALRRLWVIFEALLAFQASKLHIRCTAPGGFGASEADLKAWDAHIDTADWALAETSRSCDEKRLRTFADKEWERVGKNMERMLAQMRKALRQDVYSQILVNAVKKGDTAAVQAALDYGADPEVQDSLGNTVEEIAAFEGRKDIEDLLFEKRMKSRYHPCLAEWALDPRQLANSDQAEWFVTEYLGEELHEDRDSDEEHIIAGNTLRLSEQSTGTPHLSSRAESSHDA